MLNDFQLILWAIWEKTANQIANVQLINGDRAKRKRKMGQTIKMLGHNYAFCVPYLCEAINKYTNRNTCI